MNTDIDFQNLLENGITGVEIYNGKIATDSESINTITYFRLPSSISNNYKTRSIVYQLSCRARYIDECRDITEKVTNLLRGLSGLVGSSHIRVIDISEQGDIYENDGDIAHIPITVTLQVLD